MKQKTDDASAKQQTADHSTQTPLSAIRINKNYSH